MRLYVRKEGKNELDKGYLLRKARKLSIVEGGFSAGQSGFGDYFFIPFALRLSPTYGAFLTGVISGLQNLLAPLSEIFGNKLMKTQSRKNIVRRYAFLQALSILILIAIAFLYWFNIFTGFLPLFLVLFISIYYILGAVLVPPWFSWMGDIVSENKRGRYFAKRNRIAGIVAIIASFIGASLLDYFEARKLVMLGFVILFVFALFFRYTSYKTFTRKDFYEPRLKLKGKYYFSFFQFLGKIPFTNFGKFVIFFALLNGAVAVSSPFVTVFMLDELKFDYKVFTIITLSSSIATLLFLPLWGRFTDKYGNKRMFIIGSILIPLVPIVWMFSKSPYYLIFPSIFGGVIWGGMNLAANNFIYDSVTKEHRGLCIAYYSIVVGFSIFVGSLLGGVIITYVSITFMDKYYFLFLLSGILRALVALIILPMIKEVRRVAEIPAFSLHFSSARGFHYHLYWEHSFKEIEDRLERVFE